MEREPPVEMLSFTARVKLFRVASLGGFGRGSAGRERSDLVRTITETGREGGGGYLGRCSGLSCAAAARRHFVELAAAVVAAALVSPTWPWREKGSGKPIRAEKGHEASCCETEARYGIPIETLAQMLGFFSKG